MLTKNKYRYLTDADLEQLEVWKQGLGQSPYGHAAGGFRMVNVQEDFFFRMIQEIEAKSLFYDSGWWLSNSGNVEDLLKDTDKLAGGSGQRPASGEAALNTTASLPLYDKSAEDGD